MALPSRIKTIQCIDFEFSNLGGEIRPISAVIYIRDRYSRIHGKPEYLERWEPKAGDVTPYSTDDSSVLITFFGEAEFRCIHKLGWKIPENHFDCYVENRNLFNGLLPKQPKKLWGLEETANRMRLNTSYLETDKTDLRKRLGNGTWKQSEKEDILRYNREDVSVTMKVFNELCRYIDEDKHLDSGKYWDQAMMRGSQVISVAKISDNGIPVDIHGLIQFKENKDEIISELIEEANEQLHVFTNGKFNHAKFEELVKRNKLFSDWPRSPVGRLKTDAKTLESFEDYPDILLLTTILYFKNSLRLWDVPLDVDGRAKCYISMFNNITSRAGPAASQYLFNMSGCMKPFIVPQKDHVIIERDWEQQEFLIAAKLSNDEAMIEAYYSGDPYLSLGKQAGAIPKSADKSHHKRDVFKTVCLQLQYGSGTSTIAHRLRTTFEEAALFVEMHKRIFHVFWKWSEGVVDWALATMRLETKFGWMYQLKAGTSPRTSPMDKEGFSLNTLKNFPCQAAGAEMLRIALDYAIKAKLEVIAVVHDCIIIHAPINKAKEADDLLVECMNRASMDVIGCHTRTDKIEVAYPNRFPTKKSQHWEIFKQLQKKAKF